MSRLEIVSSETIKKAIQGDTEAFTMIYKAYYKNVFFMGVQYYRNEETAKDIVQEVFIKVHKEIKNLRDENAFNSWIHILTYRVCINYNRRKMKVIDLGEKEQIEDFADLNNLDITELVEDNRIKEIIAQSLDTMNSSLKTIGVLRFFEDLKVAEIADIVGVPKNTVGTRLVRIRKILRNDLEKQGVSVHKSYVLAMLNPKIIQEAYKILDNKYIVDESLALDILNKVLVGETMRVGGMALLPKILLTSLVSTTVIISLIIITKNHGEGEAVNNLPISHIEETLEDEIPSTSIIEINYDHRWTNSIVTLDIKTTNNNYDVMLVNGEETLEIVDNGTYLIQLITNSQVLDQREITITNIDRESPYGEGERVGEMYVLYLRDAISGVDRESIRYYKNGQLSTDYLYGLDEDTITITNDKTSKHEFYVSDYASNVLNIIIE